MVDTPTCVIASQPTADADPAAYLSALTCSTCTPSTDARCTTAALSAVFSGQPSVYAAFCNAGYLVVVASSSTGYANNIDDIPYPPGGSTTLADGSTQACRTRNASIGALTMSTQRIPLTPVQLATALPSNNLANGVFTARWDSITSEATPPVTYGLPVDGAVGFTVAGQELYPMYNNRGTFTPEQCEVDACNQHVGGGGGEPHLHGDPFGPFCLYGAQNYSSRTAHPPLIGFAIDGYQIYGRHLSVDAVGYSTALDLCGGHAHGSLPYHYHTQIIAATTDPFTHPEIGAGRAYPATTVGVYQCFRGDLSADANLNARGPTITASNACCDDTAHKYVKAGYTFAPVVAGAPPTPTRSPSSSPPVSPSRTPSPSSTPTRSRVSSTRTPSRSPVSSTRTPTRTPISPTRTPSRSVSPTKTPSRSRSSTPGSVTRTRTRTPSVTPTRTRSASRSRTRTPTRSRA